MGKPQQKIITSSYVQLDMGASINEHEDGVQGGETCHIPELTDTFAWMRGYLNMWLGWENDGKGTFTDFMQVLKAKMAGWKFCAFKPEDMDSVRTGGVPRMYKGKVVKSGTRIVKTGGTVEIKANRIYKNLAWALTGKPWNKDFAKRYFITPMTLAEEIEALEFITEHFYIIFPEDRTYTNIMDEFKFMSEKFGIDAFFMDPQNAIIIRGEKGETKDEYFSRAYQKMKDEFMKLDAVGNIINHAKSQNDEKYSTGEKKGRYKVVNQSMALGGSAVAMKMDGIYSIYRSERHLDPSDTKVHLYNLKQRSAQNVGVHRGVCEGIDFSMTKNQYYFNGVCPMTGHDRRKKSEDIMNFSEPKVDPNDDKDKLPF